MKRVTIPPTWRREGSVTSRIPLPPYPNGWFAIEHASELRAGDVKPIHALGRDFALFRGEDGRARAVDAYCPHLGAHLGRGGRVEGNTIRCPFHAWRFDGDSGRCVEIPYAGKIPPRACLSTWPVMERNGFVLVHHHAEGKPPTWEPEAIPELGDASYRLFGKREWEVETHPQEVMENGVDWQHFATLHGWKVKQMEWEPDGPYYRLKIHVDDEAQEQAATAENATEVNSYNSGPGLLFTRAVGLMTGVMVNCLTPIEPERLRIMHAYYYHEGCDPAVYEAFFAAYVRDWDLDIPIWRKKIHRLRPVLAEGDGPHFARFRRWYRQFYSEDVPVMG
jgi:phenylpropionate dioxygenase-like ring-hydroxylating dioxygenase large terminal subunit